MGSEKVFTTASSPESEGIPSRAILNFLQRIDSERICMHGFLLVRHNRIVAAQPAAARARIECPDHLSSRATPRFSS